MEWRKLDWYWMNSHGNHCNLINPPHCHMHFLSKTQICFCKSSNWKTFRGLYDAFECPTVACKAFYTIVLSSLSLLISDLFPQYIAAILDTILLPILPYFTIPSLALFCLNSFSFTAKLKGFSCLTPRIISSHFLFSHGMYSSFQCYNVCHN